VVEGLAQVGLAVADGLGLDREGTAGPRGEMVDVARARPLEVVEQNQPERSSNRSLFATARSLAAPTL